MPLANPIILSRPVIDGQFVMRNRRILTVDEAGLVAEADKVGRRIWTPVRAAGSIAIPGRPRQR